MVCSNLSIYMNDLQGVKRQWPLSILWTPFWREGMQMDGIRPYNKLNWNPLSKQYTNNFAPIPSFIFILTHSAVFLNLCQDSQKWRKLTITPSNDHYPWQKLQPQVTLAFFGSEQKMEKSYASVALNFFNLIELDLKCLIIIDLSI